MEERLPKNILIVDDYPTNLRVLTAMLKNKHYKVRKALNGESAIKAIKLEPPNLILLDIKMPSMNGYEVCEILKSQDKTKDIPVIFISALSEVFDKVKAFKIGGADYITKPFQEEEVLARINNLLIIQEQHKKLQQEIEHRKEVEEILYQSRELISRIINNYLDGIVALEAVRDIKNGNIEDFRCLVINPIVARIFNQKPEDLIGKLVFKTLDNQINPNLFYRLIELLETELSIENEFSYKYQNEEKWYDFIAVKLGDGFAITIRDITTRKKVELELNHLASIDGLTEIPNRRAFDETIVKEWKRCQREKQPLSLIMCDVDYFKFYNDFYGHHAGDDCLKKVAQTINNSIKRASDLVARYGGEEFAIILPNTDIQGAVTICKNLQKEIRNCSIPHQKSQVSDIVSVSLGIASLIPTSESSPDTLIEIADQALYRAKADGRDRYSVILCLDEQL